MTTHATCLVLGEAGILLRGPSGSGKSGLALRLLDEAGRAGRFAALVADDRVSLSVGSGRVVARPVAPLAGRIEVRGLGIVAVESEAACVVRLVVDLGTALPRLPEPADLVCELLGVSIPRLGLVHGAEQDAAVTIRRRLRGESDTFVTGL